MSFVKSSARSRWRPCLEVLEDRRLLTTFLVTSSADSGAGSLRQAIQSANAQAGTDIIDFDIAGTGVHPIALLSALPAITDPVLIDGTSQPGFNGVPLVILDGTNAGAGANGLTISAGASTVQSLEIIRFGADGIQLTTNGGNLLTGNFLGTDAAGTALGNGNDGVEIIGCSNNLVGGTTVGAGNVLSGNGRDGLTILGLGSAAATGNMVVGNKIGTDVKGAKALANAVAGVSLSNAAGNQVGGAAAGAGNVISGNSGSGVLIGGSGATGNVLQGNLIGTNASGISSLGNAGSGVSIFNGASNNTVGGTAVGAGNLISGNSVHGVSISGSAATGNVLQGNKIGTDLTGTTALMNNSFGVFIDGAANNTVGGTADGAGNLISGNFNSGIYLKGGATTNLVQGNRIGTNLTGTQRLTNGGDGVLIESAANNTVGGSDPGAGNLISGNTNDGVRIMASGASGNVVQGNLIGTDATGSAALGNFVGVEINGVPNNTVGGTLRGAGNLVSGNAREGVFIKGSGAIGNVLQGNLIGTNAAGTASLGNLIGVHINGAANTRVGGTAGPARTLGYSGNLGSLAL